jgi:hypothetical protein
VTYGITPANANGSDRAVQEVFADSGLMWSCINVSVFDWSVLCSEA